MALLVNGQIQYERTSTITYKGPEGSYSGSEYDAQNISDPALRAAVLNQISTITKIGQAPIVGEPKNNVPAQSVTNGDSISPTMGNVESINNSSVQNQSKPVSTGPSRDLGGIAPGAQPPLVIPKLDTNITTLQDKNTGSNPDLRVKIRVPADYLTRLTSGTTNFKELKELGGIIFPYTPQITIEHKADYTSQNLTHSNYAINFYKHSSVSDISITGKFTVQNPKDAIIYLSTLQLLRSLTKMRFGSPTGNNYPDQDSGAPPPVCRLDAYGDFMLKNIPVVITSVRTDLPDSVDFYTLNGSILANWFGMTSVPTVSTIQINCKPMYSRAEMQNISVSRYINDPSYKKQGYL
jgi:hypothetical protein